MTKPSTPGPWREEILHDVEHIPCDPWLPGNMVVLGLNAEPICTARTPQDVFMAAAQVGKGRIFVMGHDGYPSWFLDKYMNPSSVPKMGTFCANVLKWVTQHQYKSTWKLQSVNDNKQLNDVTDTVVVWPACDKSDVSFTAHLYARVMEGLALIVGVTPWGWAQIHEADIETSPIYLFLKQAGICLTMNVTEWKHDIYSAVISENQAVHAHCGKWLTSYISDGLRTENDHYMASALYSIPDDDVTDILNKFFTRVDIPSLCVHLPTDEAPLESNDKVGVLLVSFLARHTNMLDKLPGIDQMPGDFEKKPTLGSKVIRVQSTVHDVHPTGAYAAAGCTVTVEMLDSSLSDDSWTVQVGAHSDDLQGQDKLKRWPQLTISKQITAGAALRIKTPVGGLVYILSPHQQAHATFRLSNIVEAPLFNVTDSASVAQWATNSQAPGLWADFMGKYIQITLPSHTIRNITDSNTIASALEFWDKVVQAHHDLRGVLIHNKRRQWIVPDVQPSAGYMHSGYPIVTHLDAADPQNEMWLLRTPTNQTTEEHWGYFHELGHNMQDSDWTFEGTGEVTCNIFTLHAMLVMFGIQPWHHPWLHNQKQGMVAYLKAGADFSEWKSNPYVGLGIYAQIARDFGFDAYKSVFRHYETASFSFENENDKINKWVKVFSTVVRRNLTPVFKLWGFDVADDIVKELDEYEAYLPYDEISHTVPERMSRLEMEFNMPQHVSYAAK